MKRLGAVLAAVALVAVAFVVRDDGDEGVGGDDRSAASGPVICAEDLVEVCRTAGLDIVDEAAGVTTDRLLAEDGELGGAAWVTTSAWARLVVDERERLGFGPVADVSEVLGHTPVMIAIWADAQDVLLDRCRGRIDWRCLAEQAGTELPGGNRVRPAVPPVDSATGLVLAASQAADLLGTGDYASNDFEPGDFRVLFPRLAEGQVPLPFALMRSRGPGQMTAAGVVQADTSSTTSPFGAISVSAPRVPVSAELVVVVPAGTELRSDVAGGLAEALTSSGWYPGPSERELVPGGSVLAALRTLWAEAG